MDNPAPSRSQSCRISDSRPVLAYYESLKPGQICRRWVIRQNIIRSNVEGMATSATIEGNILRPRWRVRLG